MTEITRLNVAPSHSNFITVAKPVKAIIILLTPSLLLESESVGYVYKYYFVNPQ